MLLIWDIHLTSRIKDKLLNSLKTFIQEHNEEKNLIFLGDFVYHFSYDRNALLELYDLFLELYTQGKNLYILAWNHDRLGNTFVFEEWRKAFEILSRIGDNDNEICFITRPIVKEIEWKSICFLYYSQLLRQRRTPSPPLTAVWIPTPSCRKRRSSV